MDTWNRVGFVALAIVPIKDTLMLMRGTMTLLALLLLNTELPAADRGGQRMSCILVRFYVAKYTASTAEIYARAHGATDADIDAARRCFKTRTMQTAQAIQSLVPR
jgi:hypothetical protein